MRRRNVDIKFNASWSGVHTPNARVQVAMLHEGVGRIWKLRDKEHLHALFHKLFLILFEIP